MKGFKRYLGAITAAAVLVTAIPVLNMQLGAAEAGEQLAASTQVVLHPEKASPFNDTDGDGFGEFQGWGTSLCWWANRLGYSEALTEQAATAFFSDDGLDLNIGRYNVGGGDNVGEVEKVSPNDKADFYDFDSDVLPTYAGTSMEVSEISAYSSATYTVTDADFGFNTGDTVGSIKAIGWVNALDGTAGSGDNLHYDIDVAEAGDYTIKVIATLTGSNDRDIAIRVAEGTEDEQDYVVDSDTLNANVIASAKQSNGTTHKLYMATFSGVELKAGTNKINIAGKAGWTLDFVKMAVVKTSDLGVIPGSDFLHAPHITRSDSAVPGYAVDVTKIDTTEHELTWYEENFDRADADCGYAWNYDWSADQNQLNILAAAKEASGEDFIAEAFSNSPPYFMTNSGCSSGATDSSKDNLRTDSYKAFAKYMADVIVHWAEEGFVDFQSVTPMNEPYTDYWGANSYKQEGCHFDQGTSQSTIIEELYDELESLAAASDNDNVKKVVAAMVYSGTDETSIDTQITSYKALSDKAKSIVGRIDTHTYSGSNRAGLSALAESEGKNLWMSEVDGAYTAGTNAGNMTAGLGISQAIMRDIKGLRSTAWIMWNAVDTNVDASNDADADEMIDLYTKTNDKGQILYTPNAGYWGIALADHNTETLVLTKKYFAMGQFSRYIRPGYSIIESTGDSLAAYDPKGKKAVIVVNNTAAKDTVCEFDLQNFASISDKVTAIRTSGTVVDTTAEFDPEKLIEGENWADVSDSDDIQVDMNKQTFTATLKANSITTYIIEDVEYNPVAFYSPSVNEIEIDAANVTGSAPWNNSTVNVVTNVVDGDLTTFFDGVTNGYVQIDLGKEYKIGAFSYAPRKSFASRCVNASFYCSNDKKTWTKLYTITQAPAEEALTYVTAEDFATNETTFRYIKYAVLENDSSANCNVAEIKVYSTVVDEEYLDGNISKYVAKTENKVFEADSMKAFEDALKEAQDLLAAISAGTAEVSEAQIDKAVIKLEDAYKALKSYADKSALQALYDEYSKVSPANYTPESFSQYQALLAEAKAVLDAESPSQTEVDQAVENLQGAKAVLAVKCVLTGPKSITKTVGDGVFALNARLSQGTAVLSYVSSDANVVVVSNNGQVTVKGAGVCKVTVTATAAGKKQAVMDVEITVNPKSMVIKSAKASGSKKLKVTWKKDTTISGYEIEYSLKKNFKSGVKKVTVKKAKTTSTVIKKLKKGKKYYVRIRAYKDVTVNGQNVRLYSDWSKTKTSSKIK